MSRRSERKASGSLGSPSGSGNVGSSSTMCTYMVQGEVSGPGRGEPISEKCRSDQGRLPRVQNGYNQALQWPQQFPQLVVHPNSIVSENPATNRGDESQVELELMTSYIFLGCSRQRDASTSAKAFEIEAGNTLGQGRGGLMTPTSPFTAPILGSPSIEMMRRGVGDVPDFFSLGPSVLSAGQNHLQQRDHSYNLGAKGGQVLEQTIHDVGAPLSPFHYQLRKVSCDTKDASRSTSSWVCS